MFIFNYLISFMYAYIFRSDFVVMEDAIKKYGGLRDIFLVVISNNYSSVKLNNVKKHMESGINAVRNLSFLENMNSVKSNILANFIGNG